MNVDTIKQRTRGVIVDQIDRRSKNLSGTVRGHAANMRAMSDSLRNQGQTASAVLAETAADKLDNISHYLSDNDADRIIHDVETIARKQPVITAGIGFLIGLLGARLLKVSARERYQTYNTSTSWYRREDVLFSSTLGEASDD